MINWHEEYKRRYAELKKAGKSFFPYAVAKDTAVALLILGGLCALAHFAGAKLEDLADPTDTTYNPRPEWYFLFLFQALKFFPGKLESVAAVVLPGLGLFILILLPFLDRGPERHPLKRPFWTGLAVAAIAGIVYLTWAGYHSPLTNPIMEKDPLVYQGRRLYMDLKCGYCHAIHGRGGRVGPDLSNAGKDGSSEWLTRHFRDPQALIPGSKMPKLNLLDDEIQALVAYVKSLGVSESFTPDAPKLFEANCSACHKIGKEGGEVGPDLSLIGEARDIGYIRRYLSDPTSLNPNATMPGFKGQLTDVQIEDLARYLSAQRSGKR